MPRSLAPVLISLSLVAALCVLGVHSPIQAQETGGEDRESTPMNDERDVSSDDDDDESDVRGDDDEDTSTGTPGESTSDTEDSDDEAPTSSEAAVDTTLEKLDDAQSETERDDPSPDTDATDIPPAHVPVTGPEPPTDASQPGDDRDSEPTPTPAQPADPPTLDGASETDGDVLDESVSRQDVLDTDRERHERIGDEDDADRFRFGSYGRVQVASDLEGGFGEQTRIVFPAPRVDERSYAELELGYLAYRDPSGAEVDTVFTLAFFDDFFHFTGDPTASLAIRNLYAEARNLWFDGSFIWVGSRMYRGDDVYLLDVWPLDNLNTYGGGFGWRGEKTRVAFHTGVNRLTEDEYQFQVVDVVDERFVGEREVVFLDRLRVISSLKGEQQFGGRDGATGFKIKLYGELHALPSGELRREQPRTNETLPEDYGWTAGLQLGTWNLWSGEGGSRSFVNLFFRVSGGLAAYGELAIPFGVDQEKQALDALNVTTALSANFESEWVGVLVGGFARYFEDADRLEQDFDDGWDASWAIRPMAFIGDYFTPGIEVSQQIRRPNGLSPVTGVQETGTIWKFSVLPALTFGEGMYARPQIRLNYTVSVLDDAAQSFFPIDDVRRRQSVHHFLGAAVEWWFNSTSYQ